MSGSLHYRPEIDGLRTVAVLAVIAFHLDPSWLRGGFLGVDVFFVISGFLITSIVHGQIQRGDFSLFKFWKRRIKRLYPAMVTMVGLVLFVGGFVLIRPERTQLPKQAIAAIFSFENLWLWRTTGGYWDSSSEDIALLHTWSLSLEEQFYVCLPILLLVVHRWMRGKEVWVLSFLLIASFAACIWLTAEWRNAAFYLLPTRMWELLIGSLFAVVNAGRPMRTLGMTASTLQVVGLAMIVGSYFVISQDEGFPSYLPLLPCMGTLLIVMFGSAPGPARSFLSLGPVVYLGKISYSLYLWHWPIIVFLKYLHPIFQPWLAVCLTLPSAMLSYHWVEHRFRERVERPGFWLGVAVASFGLCCAPLWWLPASPLVRGLGNIDSPAAMTRGWEFEATQKILNRSKLASPPVARPDICVVGSSHARVLCRPISDYCREHGLEFESLVTSGIGISDTKQAFDAARINEIRMDILTSLRPRILIVAGNWAGEATSDDFASTLKERLRSMASAAEHVVVVGQVPQISLPVEYRRSMRKLLVANSISGRSLSFGAASGVQQANTQIESCVLSMGDRLSFINPYELFIGSSGEVALVCDGNFVYSDDNHLNDLGANQVFDRLMRGKLEGLLDQGDFDPSSKQATSSALRQ